jgi:hypothetical protein
MSSKFMPLLAIAIAVAVAGFDVAMSASTADAGLYRQSMSP